MFSLPTGVNLFKSTFRRELINLNYQKKELGLIII